MAEKIFWISFSIVFCVYAGYPLLLAAWRRLTPKSVRKQYWEPRVSVILAAHNEKENIERKILNCFDLDYPKDKLEVIISLDGPTDGTDELVWEYAGRGVEMILSEKRRGKATALNLGVAAATGEVLVFTDARQRLDGRAVRELVANFRDQTVGAVSGELILLDEGAKEASGGTGLYWRYEKWLRSMESDIHSMLGATGALYAIRRELYRRLPEGTVLDDVAIPMSIVLAGKRAVFDSAARAYDAACSPEAEYGRKVRTLMGNYQLLAQMPELLLPRRNPVFVQFVLHKLGRLLVPFFLISLGLSNFFLRRGGYAVFLAGQLLWYLMACAGYLVSRGHRVAHPVHVVSHEEEEA